MSTATRTLVLAESSGRRRTPVPRRPEQGLAPRLMRMWDRGGLLWVPLVIFTFSTVVPFYSLAVLATNEGASSTGAFEFWPSSFTLQHFIDVFTQYGFGIYLRNSFIIALGTAALTVPIAILTGYALSRFSFRGKNPFMLVLLMTQFIPAALMIIPLFISFRTLGLLNTLHGLILINTVFQLPLASIMMRGFISSTPIELEEAGMVDGCSRLGAVMRLVLPLLRPGIVAVGSFAFVGAWDNFIFGLFLVNDQDLYPLPVGLGYFLSEFNVDYSALAAGALIAIIPVVIIFAFIQKHLVGGLSAGAVKG